MAHTQNKRSMLNQGVFIFVYLAVLTVLEFLVALSFNSTAVLVAVALVKGALVVYYYMHIYKLNA
ncbi:MAG: cytochrome C oxidase subunit IV family protein, partial [Anaerolineales bacterium]|nr:cytochrome C oxidase subunit IV family protein [Anaerolineales bacterium]